jgi:hypothetical protein
LLTINLGDLKMPYTAEISRTNKSCILFMVDQSYSMSESFGGNAGKIKSEKTADALNKLLYELTIACTKDQSGLPRDYYEIGAIGYGDKVGSVLNGKLSGKELIPISEIAQNPAMVEERTRKVDDGAGGLVDEKIKLPVWLTPVADGGTPMCHVFDLAYSILSSWVKKNSNSFPPIVINITDGEATDGDPMPKAEKLKNLSTNDGNVLVYNLHLSSDPSAPVLFPSESSSLPPDPYALQLFEMSSNLPPHTREVASMEGYSLGNGAKGFVFNADIIAVIKFLNIGTRPKALR